MSLFVSQIRLDYSIVLSFYNLPLKTLFIESRCIEKSCCKNYANGEDREELRFVLELLLLLKQLFSYSYVNLTLC